MRQVHVQDNWTGVAYGNDREVVSDLVSRIQILENRLRDLEEYVKGITEAEEPEQQILSEPEPAAVAG